MSDCVWTYHPPDPPAHPDGYWTVVDNCPDGKSCASEQFALQHAKNANVVVPKDSKGDLIVTGVKVPHKDFADWTRAEYKKSKNKVKMTAAQKQMLLTPKKNNVFTMPCV